MNKIVISLIALYTAGAFGGESVGLIADLERSTLEGVMEKYSFKQGLSARNADNWNRALRSAGSFIQEYEPKLYSKFIELQTASNVLLNIIHIVHSKYIVPFRKKLDEGSLDSIVDRKELNNIEQEIQPLHVELKKIKGSFFSGVSLFKKSEAQKVFNAVKNILVKRIQEIIDEFKEFKKKPIIN